jgi:hypothetical protein
MKFNINIPQKIVVDNKLDVDVIDCMILEIIRDMPSFEKVEKKYIGNTVYFWVNHLNLAKENPLLGIKTSDGIYRRLIKLSSIGLLHIHPENQKSKKSYYAISEKFNNIFVKEDDKENGYFGFKTEVTSDSKPKSTSDLKPKDNNIIYDYNINDKEYSEKKFSDVQMELFVGDKQATLYSFCVDVWLKKIHPGWTFNAVHGRKIKSIITKLKQVSKNLGFDHDDKSISELFVSMMTRLPDFYKNKDLSIIDSKFNEIITEIELGTSKKSRYESIEENLRRLAGEIC